MKVKELIAALSKFDPEICVVIRDADEGCTLLNIREISDRDDCIELLGYYSDLYKYRREVEK